MVCVIYLIRTCLQKSLGGKNTFLQISLASSADARDIGNLGDVSISL